MSLLGLGTASVHRTDFEIQPEMRKPLRAAVAARAGPGHILGTTPSPDRTLRCAGVIPSSRLQRADKHWVKSPGKPASPCVGNFEQQSQCSQWVDEEAHGDKIPKP